MSGQKTADATGRIRRVAKAVALPVTVVALVLCCCGGSAFSYFLGGLSEPTETYAYGCGVNGGAVNPDGSLPRMSELTQEQLRNAAIIIQVGQSLNVPPHGWVVAVATARQESWLRNLGHLGTANDHDSLGLFQQRPSTGWGTPEEIMDPRKASEKFYKKLVEVKGWETMALTDAAQAVQISAYPDAYAKHEYLATRVVNLLTNGAARAVGSSTNLQCAEGLDVTAAGWTAPLDAPVTSGFRTRDRPDHYGIDFPADKETDIRAAAAGTVATVMCNAPGWGCDRDGSPLVSGCGWYVDIKHAGGIMTRYCHMIRKPLVTVGQRVAPGAIIGKVGSTGNSSGPHLHFEVHTGGGTGNNSAVDPVDFMKGVGVILRVKS